MIMKAILTVLGLLALLPSAYGQDPEITERIIPEIKRLGTTGRLHCTVINKQDYPVYWIHKDAQTTISSDDKILIDPIHNQVINGWPKFMVEKSQDGQKLTFTLIINRLEPRDMGNYTCQILVRGSSRHPSKDGQMIVLAPPAVLNSVSTHTITVKEGDNVNLTCDATGYPMPNITWVRVNANALPNEKIRERSKIFPIPSVTKDDRGIYRCLADNNVRPPSSHDATLYVLFKPEGNAIQSSYGQAQNRMFDLTIECRVSGYPEPDLQWYKENQAGNWDAIRNTDKHEVNILLNHANLLAPQERWFQLIIRNVQASDYGDYKCEGKNAHGNGWGKINVYETSECQGANCPPETIANGAVKVRWTASLLLLVSATHLLPRLSGQL